ncbi:MAG: hypothetical protein ACXWMN_05125 [Candidatus Limnocylindria bacterium]
MDDVALRYLLLGLRLGRHVPGLVRWYAGPRELAEAVEGEPPTPIAELHDEALQLGGLAAELSGETPALSRRKAWLAAQAEAMGVLARRVDGEEIGYVDLVEELFDIEVHVEPETTFEAARRMLDRALPGAASLQERLAAHDLEARVPPGRLLDLLARLADGLRARTRAQMWLPPRESLRFGEAHAVEWETMARYVGRGRSLVQVNLDRPVTVSSAVELAAREGYPGRHSEASAKDELLVAAGHAELALAASLTPQALVSEGIAILGREVVMSDQELAAELQRIGRLHGQRLDLDTELVVLRARRLLVPALGNAAVALHRDGEPVAQVRSYLAEVALVSDDRLDATISRLTDPVQRAEPFARIEGGRLVAEWLEVHGQTRGFARLLAEQFTPGELRSGLATG